MNSVNKIFDIPHYQLEKHPLQKAFSMKVNGQWTSISIQEYIQQYNQLSLGLLELGVQPNDKIAVISSTNRTEWHILDMAILQTGAQNVPIYPNVSAHDYEYILNHSEAIYCFVSDTEILEKINKIKDKTGLKGVYTFDDIPNEQHWSSLINLCENSNLKDTLEIRKNSIQPNDLATIIYTSGTTGKPKGVMLSHQNLVSNAIGCTPRLPLKLGESKALSFLPICHVFERMIIYFYMYSGIEIYFAESIETIGDNLKEINPNIMTAVPRLYEKIYEKIYAKGCDLKGIKRKMFDWALALGFKYDPNGSDSIWYNFQLAIARKFVFSKWRAGLGGNIDALISGSAALQPRLVRVFSAAQMPILEGYGLTETSPVIAVNDIVNMHFKIGTVGKAIDNVTIKIADDGEILVKGPNVMLGYFKDPEKTAEIMTGAYFHTEDIGELDADGFLKITDRKKQMFKTSGGKYIAPTLVENQLKESKFIEQVMVIGEGEKMPAALIQPNFIVLKKWANENKINYSNVEELISLREVKNYYQEELNKCNQHIGKWEQIKCFELTPDEWTVKGGHLTPTMKVKRKKVEEIYTDLKSKIYRH